MTANEAVAETQNKTQKKAAFSRPEVEHGDTVNVLQIDPIIGAGIETGGVGRGNSPFLAGHQ